MFTGSFLILLCWHFAALPPDVARCASTSALRPNQPSRNAFRKRINKRTSTAHISCTSMASVAVLHVLRTAHDASRESFPLPLLSSKCNLLTEHLCFCYYAFVRATATTVAFNCNCGDRTARYFNYTHSYVGVTENNCRLIDGAKTI